MALPCPPVCHILLTHDPANMGAAVEVPSCRIVTGTLCGLCLCPISSAPTRMQSATAHAGVALPPQITFSRRPAQSSFWRRLAMSAVQNLSRGYSYLFLCATM